MYTAWWSIPLKACYAFTQKLNFWLFTLFYFIRVYQFWCTACIHLSEENVLLEKLKDLLVSLAEDGEAGQPWVNTLWGTTLFQVKRFEPASSGSNNFWLESIWIKKNLLRKRYLKKEGKRKKESARSPSMPNRSTRPPSLVNLT